MESLWSEGTMTRIRLSKADEDARTLRERLELSTAEIGLCVRTTNCLEEKGIFTVRDLLNSTPDTLLSITNFGEKTLLEVYQALERIGFRRPKPKRTLGVFSESMESATAAD
jgi:DNA-directed RNA polymerase subunit alpha